MKFGTGEVLMQNVINGIGTLPSSSNLLKSLVRIKRSSYLKVDYITASNYNWLMETPTLDATALTRANMFSFKDFYGHMIIRYCTFADFVGMSNSMTTSSPLFMSFALATSPMKSVATNIPLIYFDPLKTSMKKFEFSSNSFSNIKSWQEDLSQNPSYLLQLYIPSANSETYHADTIIMNSNYFSNIDCYYCNAGMIKLMAKSLTFSSNYFN